MGARHHLMASLLFVAEDMGLHSWALDQLRHW